MSKIDYKKIKEIVATMMANDQCSKEYDKACCDLNEEMGNAHRESLYQLTMFGPTYDGDVISKSARDDLMDWGLASRVCVRGEQGFTGANYRGWDVLKSVPRASYSLERKPITTVYALFSPVGEQIKVGTLEEITAYLPNNTYPVEMYNALFTSRSSHGRRIIFREYGWIIKQGMFLEDER